MGALERIETMLEQLDSVQLSSITDDGYPRICEMEVTARRGMEEFFFTTKRGSNKIRHYLRSPKAGVGFCIGDDCASLLGTVELVENSPLLGARDGAKWCILRFRTSAGKLFVGGTFSEFGCE